jgi:hypothetical protein
LGSFHVEYDGLSDGPHSPRPLPPNASRGCPGDEPELDDEGWQRFEEASAGDGPGAKGSTAGDCKEPRSLVSSPDPADEIEAATDLDSKSSGGLDSKSSGGGGMLSASVAARMWREIAEADSPRRYSSIVETALLLAELVRW